MRKKKTERQPKKPVDYWPSWRYGPNGESAIFANPDCVPLNWTRKPGIPEIEPVHYREPTRLSREDLIAELEVKGIKLDPLWSTAHIKELLD